jgi:hypothetical protein
MVERGVELHPLLAILSRNNAVVVVAAGYSSIPPDNGVSGDERELGSTDI